MTVRSLILVGCLLGLLSPLQGARAELNCNVGIEFHDDGRLRSCVLNGDHRLYTESGVALTCADGRRLEHHRDGTLAVCTLASPVNLDGQRCDAGDVVRFDAAGRLLQCKAEAPD